jgi:hypothetical protein
MGATSWITSRATAKTQAFRQISASSPTISIGSILAAVLTEADLAHAPILLNWEPKLTPAQEPAIRGVVRGHPAIPDGETLRAEILAVDPDLSWIRTWTGFFRLTEQTEQAAYAASTTRAWRCWRSTSWA